MTDQQPPRPPTDRPTHRDVQYKGEPLDAAKGPGLGCFWTQIVVLVGLLVLTPLSVQWGWPVGVSAALLVAVLVLLLISGQTIIFLLRLVAADRRAAGRRRPLASGTKTVGELDDAPTPQAGTPAEAPTTVAASEPEPGPDLGGRPPSAGADDPSA